MMEIFPHNENHDFDLELVLQALKRCPAGGGDIDLREYLVAYNELCRFFKMTGRLFGFVAKDLEHKISAIERKQNSDEGQHYTTAEKMIQFEINSPSLVHKGQNKRSHSGTRTLLRLHWALEFILEFMSRMSKCSDHERTSKIATEVYEQTLSKYHPWLTRKMAAIAVYLLPSRKDLIHVMCKQDYQTVLQLLDKVVDAGKRVYDLIENIYRDHNLHNIP
ncbi:ceramide-1-phosphate transfer protein-like [Mercenaria mercenaria]|uniref:ceramide-1-phosphate transfer protein-like n=1 Tax=Mercenaria mercenaria TaxID=6596 RepID=UPI00234E85EE|nr:ceramide-1-phosphate transfer protein-like [Mercenaria mercenaria]